MPILQGLEAVCFQQTPRLRTPDLCALRRIHSIHQAMYGVNNSDRKRVAINISAGGRWPKKMLTAHQIHRYIQLLAQRMDVDILLVGGVAEAKKASAIMRFKATPKQVQPA